MSDMLKIDYRHIEVTKSESTLLYYNSYWNNLKKLINLSTFHRIFEVIYQL